MELSLVTKAHGFFSSTFVYLSHLCGIMGSIMEPGFRIDDFPKLHP